MVVPSQPVPGDDVAIVLPETYTAEWAVKLARQLDSATRCGLPLKQVLPAETVAMLFSALANLLVKEPTLLEVRFVRRSDLRQQCTAAKLKCGGNAASSRPAIRM